MRRQNKFKESLFLVGTFVVLLLILASSQLLSAEPATDTSVVKESIFFTFAGIFFIGLMLNLTPCVYPMLTITVTILSQTGDGQDAPPFVRALIYVLGMATMYSMLGAFAAVTGGLFGSVLQSSALLLLISFLFIVLSLSMFGFYELQPPAWLLSKIAAKRSASLLGLFVSGLFVGVFAAPCVGPPVIALLTMVGQRGDALYGFLVFFTLSMGLGLPYMILGSFSGLLQKLPRSGSWMVWCKNLLGILLVALGLFYFSLALNPGLAFTMIPITLLIGGLYYGFIAAVPNSSSIFRFVRYAAGAALIAAAVYGWSVGRLQAIDWMKYSADYSDSGKASILYFSASWCIPCLELDRRTFTDSAVIRSVADLATYKIDLSSFESENSRQIRQRYKIAGVPTLIFIDASGQERKNLRVSGFIKPEDFLARIQSLREAADTSNIETSISSNVDESTPSEVSLVSEFTQVTPGQTFMIGAQFKMLDGWHVYWKNPGDSGTEPQFIWELTDGLKIGEPLWPAPQMFLKPPFATFGHENELLLPFSVKVPESIEPGQLLNFRTDISWLVCKEICIGQDGSASLTVKVGEKAVASELQVQFSEAVAALPYENRHFTSSFTSDSKTTTLKFVPKSPMTLEELSSAVFYPSDPGLFRHGYTRIEAEGSMIVINLIRTGIPLPETLNGVFSLDLKGSKNKTHLNVSIKKEN